MQYHNIPWFNLLLLTSGIDTLTEILFCKSVPFEISQADGKPEYERKLLLHLALKCITFTVGQFITFSVKLC